MMSHWKTALVGGTAILAAATGAFAQNAPPPTGNAPLFDPAQLPVFKGKVQLFTLTPRGDIDGMILTDGTEVKTPPHLSSEIAYAVKLGDAVTIHGLKAAALPLIQATSVTGDASGVTVVDNGPPGGPSGPPGPRRGPDGPPPPPPGGPDPGPGPDADRAPGVPMPGLSEAGGAVKMTLHGPRGDVDGALLDDGTVLRLPPPEAARFADLLQPGQTVVVAGIGRTSPLGKMLDVRQIGTTRDQLSQVRGPGRGPGPDPRDRKRPPGPPPR
jgi:hypothetical protein